MIIVPSCERILKIPACVFWHLNLGSWYHHTRRPHDLSTRSIEMYVECTQSWRISCTLLGVQSWERFYQQEFGEFPWPAWAVGSYSSGPPMTWKPMSVDIIHLFWIRGLVTYHLIPVVVAVPQVDESFFTGHDSAHHLTMIFKVILIGHCIRGWQHQSRLFLEAKTCGATPPPIINI